MVTLDSDEMVLEYTFLEYDYSISQQKILDAGLPSFLSERLGMGQ
jgi:hypothetical protein